MWVLIKKIAQFWDTEETVQHSYEIQYNNCNKVRFRHFDTQDLLRSKHSTFLLYIMRKSFWNENGWPVVFISRRLTDMHGIRFMRGFKEGGSGITPFLGKFKFNKFTLFNFWNGPWTRLENKIIPCRPPPSTLQQLSRSAHETGNGTYAPAHFEFPLVRPSVRIIRWTQCS